MENIKFDEFKEKVRGQKEGIVLLGCGGDLNEWTNGVTNVLYEEGISRLNKLDEVFPEIYILKTTGGRTDIAMIFNSDYLSMGKMAMWRLRFGDCSWISDYIVNYADHHNPLLYANS